MCGIVRAHLFTGCTSGLDLFGVVALAVEVVLEDAIRQIDEELVTDEAGETGRVPGRVLSALEGNDPEVSPTDDLVATRAFLGKQTKQRDRAERRVERQGEIKSHGPVASHQSHSAAH